MAVYISKALKQASYEVYSATLFVWHRSILGGLDQPADWFFYFEGGPRDEPRLTAKRWNKMKDQRTLEAFLDLV